MAQKQQNPGPNEQYCTQCGGIIKSQAEMCPHCGVENSHSTSEQASSYSSYNPEPSGKWVTGIKVSIGIWVIIGILLVMISRTIGGGLGQLMQGAAYASLVPVLQIVGWILVAVSMYKDTEYVNYHTDDWPLNSSLYIGGSIGLPILTQILAIVGYIIPGGAIIAMIIPGIITYMCIKHIQTRKKELPATAV